MLYVLGNMTKIRKWPRRPELSNGHGDEGLRRAGVMYQLTCNLVDSVQAETGCRQISDMSDSASTAREDS